MEGNRMNTPDARLDGQVAVISGGGQGLGEAFAWTLARAGATVALLDAKVDQARSVADALNAAGLRAHAFACDVTDKAQCQAAADAVRSTLGAASVLVNNAGVASAAQLADDNFNDEIDRLMGVNLKGALNLTQAFVPQLTQTRGAIVNIASIAALLATFSSIAYAASKAALAQATRFLARDLAPSGIRVNALAPGLAITPLTAHLQREGSRAERAAQRTLMKRVAQPDDIAGPLLFLATDLSKYITGLVLPVDGGYSAN